MLKKWDYVTDASASGRYYTAVYRLLSEHGDRWLVEYAGDVINGRLRVSRDRTQTYRDTQKLQPWRD